MTGRTIALLALSLTVAGCRRSTPDRVSPAAQQVVAWRAVGSWSGDGSRQTESFRSESGALRLRWTTRAAAGAASGSQVFKVTAHSAISGRLLEQAVDHTGAGSGIAYVNQDPHVFYLMVESGGLEWSLSAEEAIAATVTGR